MSQLDAFLAVCDAKTYASESDIQKDILDYLEHRPDVWAMRVNAGAVKSQFGGWVKLGPTGVADIVGWKQYVINGAVADYINAIFLAVEVKDKRGKVKKKQREFLDRVRDAGGIAIVARSVRDVHEALEAA